jgi:hypothetical protein
MKVRRDIPSGVRSVEEAAAAGIWMPAAWFEPVSAEVERENAEMPYAEETGE